MKSKSVDRKSSRSNVRMTSDVQQGLIPPIPTETGTGMDQLDGRIEHDGTLSNSTSQPVLYL